MAKLIGQKGGFAEDLRKSHDRATDIGFDKVAKVWIKNGTMPYDNLAELVEQSAAKTSDSQVKLSRIKPVLNGNLSVVVDGQKWAMSRNAEGQFLQLLNLSPKFVQTAETDEEKEILGEFLDERMKTVVGGKDKDLFIRFRGEGSTGSIRAFLTQKYMVIDHRFVLEQMRKYVPGGLVSHFDFQSFHEFEGDYLKFNVLIPDTIREEKDSDYGGMLSISNNEIGRGRFGFDPSVFRHICVNGCIWNQEKGETFSQVHRGQWKPKELSCRIAMHIHEQIPLLTTGIDNMLKLNAGVFKDGNVLKMILLLKETADYNFTYQQIRAIIEASEKEELAGAFAFVNAITRAAQNRAYFDWQEQDELEILAGNYMSQWLAKPSKYETFVKRSNEIENAKLVKVLTA